MVLQVNYRKTRPDAIRAEGTEILAVDFDIGTPTGRGGAAHAHRNHAFGKIGGFDSGNTKIAQLQLEVRTDAVVKRIAAKTGEALAPDVELRVRHHCAESEHPRTPAASGAVANRLRFPQCLNRIPLPHKPNIRVYSLNTPHSALCTLNYAL